MLIEQPGRRRPFARLTLGGKDNGDMNQSRVKQGR